MGSACLSFGVPALHGLGRTSSKNLWFAGRWSAVRLRVLQRQQIGQSVHLNLFTTCPLSFKVEPCRIPLLRIGAAFRIIFRLPINRVESYLPFSLGDGNGRGGH